MASTVAATSTSTAATCVIFEASNAVEVELPASPGQRNNKSRRQFRPRRSLQQQSPVIYVELDRPSQSSSDEHEPAHDEPCNTCGNSNKDKPIRSLHSSKDVSFLK